MWEIRTLAIALISDIHGNLEALQAVLKDVEARGIEKAVCLGDIVGYGPNPCECLDLVVEHCEWALLGNHDFAVLFEPTNFNVAAEQACYWTRKQFEDEPDDDIRRKRWEALGLLKIRMQVNNAICVHASPRRPIDEYIFPDDPLTAPMKMSQIFERVKERAFVGHTHVPGVFTDEPDFYPPSELGDVYTFNGREKCIINPGSVGQPRDRDPRASYAVLHDDKVEFVRLEYDIQSVVTKIKAQPELNDFCGLRLLEGR